MHAIPARLLCLEPACKDASRLVLEVESNRRVAEQPLAEHVEALRHAARFICREDGEREDLIQDTFERALRFLAGNPPPTNPRAWLISILRNAFIDRRRRAKLDIVELDDAPAVEPEPAAPWAAVSVEDVQAALAGLDVELRRLFELHYIEKLRYGEIAVRLGIPANTVASRLYRARRALRSALLQEES